MTEPAPIPRRRPRLSATWIARLIVLLVVARFVVVAVHINSTPVRNVHGPLTGDVRNYRRIATHAGAPYRDFPVEFPPVTLGVIKLLEGTDVRTATVRLGWSQALCDLAVAGALGFGWGRRTALAYLVVGLPLLAFPFVYLRLDLLSVALASWGVALLHRRVERTGGVVLAVATFAKLWPLALAPLLLVQRRRRALVAYVVAGLSGLGAWLAWGGVDGPAQVLTFRGAKGWEIESVVGAVVRVTRDLPVRFEEGALRVGEVPSWASVVLGVGAIASILTAWWFAARARGQPGVVDGVAPLTAVTGLLVFSPLLSPQYACWLLPFAAVALVAGWRPLALLDVLVTVLSVLLGYWITPVRNGDVIPLSVLFVRNAMLVTLCVSGLLALRRSASSVVAAPHAPLLPSGATPSPVPRSAVSADR